MAVNSPIKNRRWRNNLAISCRQRYRSFRQVKFVQPRGVFYSLIEASSSSISTPQHPCQLLSLAFEMVMHNKLLLSVVLQVVNGITIVKWKRICLCSTLCAFLHYYLNPMEIMQFIKLISWDPIKTHFDDFLSTIITDSLWKRKYSTPIT